MNIVRKFIYLLFILLLFTAFVFFGGGGALIRAGEKMEQWEIEMKSHLGKFCREGEKELKKKTGKVKDAWQKKEEVD